MSDKELLELAAKAAGMHVKAHRVDADDNFTHLVVGQKFKPEKIDWNPLNDDGDGARMEAALGIHVAWHSDGVVCGLRWAGSTELFDDHGGDKQAARRMASLRVAAEHGKAMP